MNGNDKRKMVSSLTATINQRVLELPPLWRKNRVSGRKVTEPMRTLLVSGSDRKMATAIVRLIRRARQIAVVSSFLLADKEVIACLLYTSPSPRDRQKSRMPSSA